MSVGFANIGIIARELENKFGTNYGMFQEFRTYGGASTLRDGFAGNGSNGSVEESLWSAPADGKLVLVKIHVTANTSTGNVIVREIVGGTSNVIGTILAGQTGDFTFLCTLPFLKDDRIGWSYQKLGTGNMSLNAYYEINLVDVGKDVMVGSSGRFFGGQFGSNYMDVPAPQNRGSGPPADSRQFEWQLRMSRAGVIKDMWWYGTNPSGTGAGTIAARVNGAASHEEILPIHGGASLDRFDNIDEPFLAGDLIGGSLVKLGANCEGTLSFRIEFD